MRCQFAMSTLLVRIKPFMRPRPGIILRYILSLILIVPLQQGHGKVVRNYLRGIALPFVMQVAGQHRV
jgi:hypothetical protein